MTRDDTMPYIIVILSYGGASLVVAGIVVWRYFI